MPRWLNFVLGLASLIVIAVGSMRIVMRHLPDVWWSGRLAYEVTVALLGLELVAITVQAMSPRQGRAPPPS